MIKTRSMFFWAFIAPIWIIPLVGLYVLANPTSSIKSPIFFAIPFTYAYHVFIRIPHFFATFAIVDRKDFIKAVSENIFKYVFAPLILFVTLLLMISSTSEYIKLAVRIFMFMGVWHIAMQGYGISLLVGKPGTASAKDNRRLLYSFYVLQFLAMAFSGLYSSKNEAVWFGPALFVVFGLIAINLALQIMRLKDNRRLVFYNLVYTSFAIPMLLLKKSGSAFYFYDALHCINYLGLTYRISYANGPIRKPVLMYLFSCALSILVIYLFAKEHPMKLMIINNIESFFVLFFGMHYYYESFIWRDPTLKLKEKLKAQSSEQLLELQVAASHRVS